VRAVRPRRSIKPSATGTGVWRTLQYGCGKGVKGIAAWLQDSHRAC
jgi:hypothetical protein